MLYSSGYSFANFPPGQLVSYAICALWRILRSISFFFLAWVARADGSKPQCPTRDGW
jgi:hypothetical protein